MAASKVLRITIDSSVDLLSPRGLLLRSPVLKVAILNWQLSNTRSWSALLLLVTSWGPYTVANALVLPISTYAEPSAWPKTPILQTSFRSSFGLRPSRRNPSGDRISNPAILGVDNYTCKWTKATQNIHPHSPTPTDWNCFASFSLLPPSSLPPPFFSFFFFPVVIK